MANLEQNTWETDTWYAQYVAGNVEYQGAQELYTWGNSPKGESGRNQGGPAASGTTRRSSPTQVGSAANWYNISGYYDGFNFAARKTDGSLWAWGNNDDGQLCQNDKVARSSPTQIPGTDWAISGNMTWSNVWGIKTDGTLWGAGNNGYGALGLSNTTKYSSPMQLPGTTWSTAKNTFGGNMRGTAAIKTDGTLWTWGENEWGLLGQNDTTDISSPKQVGTDTNWATLSKPPRYFQAAIKTDGTLWTWGMGNKGNLGLNQQGDNHQKSSPTQVPGTTWKLVCGGAQSAHATKTDGTLWSWGNGGNGKLGHNETTYYSSPTQVGTSTDWDIPLNFSSFCGGIKTDGTMWGCGYNGGALLGQNSIIDQSSPVQVPGVWVDMGGAGESSVMAAINMV